MDNYQRKDIEDYIENGRGGYGNHNPKKRKPNLLFSVLIVIILITILIALFK